MWLDLEGILVQEGKVFELCVRESRIINFKSRNEMFTKNIVLFLGRKKPCETSKMKQD